MRAILLTVLIAAPFPAAATEPSILGAWARGDGIARVRIEPCGAALCAINTWIKEGVTGEKVGDKLVMNVKPESETLLVGSAWDPQRRLGLSMRIDVEPSALKTTGCVLGGWLCKSMSWAKLH